MPKATMKLYEIAAEYRAAADQLMNLDLDEQTVQDTLESIDGDLVDKVLATVAVAESMDAEAAAVAAAAKRTAERAKALQNRAARLRDYVLHTMVGCKVNEAARPDLSVKVRDLPGSVVVEDEEKVPELYVVTEVVTTKRVDKAAALPLLRAGAAIEGLRLQTGHRLEVK